MTEGWVKSSHSGPEGGECLEWAPGRVAAQGVVPVRDSKCPGGPILLLAPGAFVGLVALARGEGAS
ncbi:DUF397 domain-containing protein [Streptomyces yaizuensis]|uniref:DUF397 domain-containing protein n=1 Tax=Streptomyces yaizuensis TaxID=2989713 RepID=A0ABQ5NTX1_9ACTN|nr:DUF397 domain-containing protein [Streptomyces sp. YSPA8]GLF93593.1 DUF397 domain-containing protein [Streptomyces sp. YSPA8]